MPCGPKPTSQAKPSRLVPLIQQPLPTLASSVGPECHLASSAPPPGSHDQWDLPLHHWPHKALPCAALPLPSPLKSLPVPHLGRTQGNKCFLDSLRRPFRWKGKKSRVLDSHLTSPEAVSHTAHGGQRPRAFMWLTFQHADMHLPTLSQPNPKLPLP